MNRFHMREEVPNGGGCELDSYSEKLFILLAAPNQLNIDMKSFCHIHEQATELSVCVFHLRVVIINYRKFLRNNKLKYVLVRH